jgi:hypothetical protein
MEGKAKKRQDVPDIHVRNDVGAQDQADRHTLHTPPHFSQNREVGVSWVRAKFASFVQ